MRWKSPGDELPALNAEVICAYKKRDGSWKYKTLRLMVDGRWIDDVAMPWASPDYWSLPISPDETVL